MMVDKAVSTNDNNFNEFSRAYKYDAVISTLIENKILSIKKECKENSTSKRKRRKSSRKISFSRKFFVSCRSKRSSIGSGISNNNDVSITKQEGSLSIPVIDNDCNIDAHKTDIHLYDFDDGTVSATIENLSKTTVSQVLSKTSSSAIAADVTIESIGGYSGGGGGGVVRTNEIVQPKILRSISSSHDDTDFNISSQNEQSTSKLLLLKDISTSSSIALQHHHHPKHHHRNDPSLSSSTSSSVALACGPFDENIHMRVIDKKRIKNGDGDDGSGGIIGDISSNESIDISDAIVGPTTSSSIKETDKELHHVKHTKKSLIPDGLVASIKHSFHSLALYNQYNNNKTAADVENNFLYEAKSISAPTSPTMLFSQNIIKSQTMMISSENVKSQVSYIRKSIRCPNYNSNKITINNNNTNNNTNINNSNNINKNNKKTFKNSLSEIFSRQNTSEDSANVTISTLLNEDEIVNTTIATATTTATTTAISTATNTTATNNISNLNLLKDNTFHSSNSHLNNNNKIMDSNSIVIELNDELSSSNQFVENRLDSTDVVSAATATITTTTINKKSQNLNDSSLFIKQNESSNQSKLNSETVIINNKHSDIITAIGTTTATNTLTDNNELKNDKSKILSATTTSTATTTTTTAEIIGKLKKSDELFQNLLANQNLSNVSSILPSSMTGSNLMSINSSYTSQITKTHSTATAATKSFDRNALLASRIINGRYLHSGSDDEYRRNKRKYKRYHRCSDPVLVYPSTSGLQHCILSMPPNQIHQINCNEDFVYDLTYQADQNINNDDKESIVPEPVKKSRHHKHKKKHRHRQKPQILVHDLDTQCVKVIDPDDLPQRARWTIIATACLLLLMCLMLVGITLRMAPIIDDIVRQENERLMQESINRAMLAKNYTESNF